MFPPYFPPPYPSAVHQVWVIHLPTISELPFIVVPVQPACPQYSGHMEHVVVVPPPHFPVYPPPYYPPPPPPPPNVIPPLSPYFPPSPPRYIQFHVTPNPHVVYSQPLFSSPETNKLPEVFLMTPPGVEFECEQPRYIPTPPLGEPYEAPLQIGDDELLQLVQHLDVEPISPEDEEVEMHSCRMVGKDPGGFSLNCYFQTVERVEGAELRRKGSGDDGGADDQQRFLHKNPDRHFWKTAFKGLPKISEEEQKSEE